MIIEIESGAEGHHFTGALAKGCQAPGEVTECRTLSQKGGGSL